MSTIETWSRIDEIYQKALGLEGEERSAYLADACGGEAQIRQRVEELLSTGRSPRYRFAAGDLLAGRFRIVRFLAYGGMGEVFEAEDVVAGEAVALKILHPEHATEAAVRRLRREIRLTHRLSHPALCRNHDIFLHKGEGEEETARSFVLSMELLRGETLQARLRREGRFRPAAALALLRQIVSGVAAAHLQGIVHRDLKSSNVLLVPAADGERAVVTDFGLARLSDDEPDDDGGGGSSSRITDFGEVLGTPAYMAPEQILEGEITPATDVYALGVLLFEMLTGKRPFPGETLLLASRRLVDDPPSPRAYAEDLESWWEEAVLRCLKLDPEERFASGGELLAALERGAASRPWYRIHWPRRLSRH